MKKIDCNYESSRTIKQSFKFWRVLRDRIKGWWMQWPNDYLGENSIDRYHRVEHWKEYRIRRQDIADILTRR